VNTDPIRIRIRNPAKHYFSSVADTDPLQSVPLLKNTYLYWHFKSDPNPYLSKRIPNLPLRRNKPIKLYLFKFKIVYFDPRRKNLTKSLSKTFKKYQRLLEDPQKSIRIMIRNVFGSKATWKIGFISWSAMTWQVMSGSENGFGSAQPYFSRMLTRELYLDSWKLELRPQDLDLARPDSILQMKCV